MAAILCAHYADEWGYELAPIPFVEPAKNRKYTPDFWLANGIIIETKGRWTRADRLKMRMIREQHPDLDIRMLFSNARARISKTSKTTYAAYAESIGYEWAHKVVPFGWLDAEPEATRVAAMNALIGG